MCGEHCQIYFCSVLFFWDIGTYISRNTKDLVRREPWLTDNKSQAYNLLRNTVEAGRIWEKYPSKHSLTQGFFHDAINLLYYYGIYLSWAKLKSIRFVTCYLRVIENVQLNLRPNLLFLVEQYLKAIC